MESKWIQGLGGERERRLLMEIDELRRYYQRLIQQYERELGLLPPGRLNCKNIRGKSRYYIEEKGKYIYLPASSEETLQALARKRVIEKSLPRLRAFEKQMGRFLKGCADWSQDAQEALFKNLPVICQPFLPREDDWLSQAYLKNPAYPEKLIHRTAAGDLVRSRAEALILDRLYSYGIPYRYEAQLVLGTKIFYPDVTIQRPVDGRLVYWEHFGMMEQEGYAKHAYQKMDEYKKCGLILFDNLIITDETAQGGIDMMQIDRIIKAVILS